MAREAFLIYTSFYKPISKLSDKQLGRLFRAVFRYNLGEVFDVEEDIEMAFEFFKNQFEIDESKYQSKVMRDIENGRKGGNPNFAKGKRNPYYPTAKKITQDNRGLSEITEDKAINDNDKDNVNVLKETSYGGKEKPETAAEPEWEFPEGSFPGTGLEGCESFPVEAGNLPKKENSGGAAQNPASGGVSQGGMAKPPGGGEEPRSAAENAEICRESPSWLAAVAMLNRMTVEEVKAELDRFQTHLMSYGEEKPKTLKDFKSHFNNLLRKQKEDADDSAKARGARKGTGEAAAGGMGSGAERPRPKPLF